MDNKNKTFKPTEAIKNNSLRGNVLLDKSNAISAKSALVKLKDIPEKITKSELNLSDVKLLYSFLIKAEEKYKPLNRTTNGGLDVDSSAYLAAGGSSALAWTRRILKQENVLKSYTKDIPDSATNQEEVLKGINLPISKAVNEELMQVLYVAMLPDVVDAHGDVTTADEVRKACHNFNQHCMKANLFHLVETTAFSVVESFIVPADFILGERLVKSGTWLVNLQINEGNEDLWELIKSGYINGVSIGALACVNNIEDNDDN